MNFSVNAACRTVDKWGVLVALAILSLLTYLSLSYVERFYVAEEQPVTNSDFQQGLAGWQEKGSGKVNVLDSNLIISNSLQNNQTVSQVVSVNKTGFYRVSFDATVTDIEPRSGRLAGPGVWVKYHKEDGAKKFGTRFLVPADQVDLHNYQFDTYLRNDVMALELMLRLTRASGEFKVGNLKLSRLEYTAFYKMLRAFVVGVWLLAGVALVFILVRSLSLMQSLPFAGFCIAALIGALAPETVFSLLSQKLIAAIPPDFPAVWAGGGNAKGSSQGRLAIGVSEIGHFAIFMMLGFLAGINSRKVGLGFAALSLGLFAITTEVLQLLVVRRTPSLADLATDGLGASFGLLAGCCCLLAYTTIFKK